MSRPKKQLPTYGTTQIKGIEYFRTRITDSDGKRVTLYAKTPEELLEKVEEAKAQIADAKFRIGNGLTSYNNLENAHIMGVLNDTM